MPDRTIDALAEFVAKATLQYRKGDPVTTRQHGNVEVVEIYAMPHESEAQGHVTVDVGFMTIGFTEAAAEKDEFLRLLKDALSSRGEFQDLTVSEFLGGPSYITAGAWIGDQGLALRLYGLLEHYGLGMVILPRMLGVTGEEEARLMGEGFVMFMRKPGLEKALTA